MTLSYKNILCNPNIPLNDMHKYFKIKSKLYKYQSFGSIINNTYHENPYWQDNMKGTFHLSLANEFEDTNDCLPHINIDTVISEILTFFSNEDLNIRRKIEQDLTANINSEYLEKVTNNYKKDIYIGCFTKRATNKYMWKKYANLSTGFCIEYDTSKNELFKTSTLPIFYSNIPYNSSWTLIANLILSATQQGKARTLEENINSFQDTYKQLLKTAYIPLFYKLIHFKKEEEIRMFLLNHFFYKNTEIKRSDIVNSKNNIDLSESVSAIYLGEHFSKNPSCDKKISIIKQIVYEKNIKLYYLKRKTNGSLYPLEYL